MNVKWVVRGYLVICAFLGALALFVRDYPTAFVCAIMGTIVATS